MPDFPEYEKLIESDLADVRNTSKDGCGAIAAGLFLKKFTEGLPWLHLDIAGTAGREKAGVAAPGGRRHRRGGEHPLPPGCWHGGGVRWKSLTHWRPAWTRWSPPRRRPGACADRLELCANLVIGGTTPTLPLFHAVREASGLPSMC